jgi:SAM-dependent methyltransferase
MNAIDTLLRRIKEDSVSRSGVINPFWTAQLAKFQTLLSDVEHPTDKQIRSALGYNDESLPDGVNSNRELPDWPELEKNIAAGNVDLPLKACEHVGALFILKAHGILDHYLQIIDEMRIRSSMTVARHYWYARRLQKQIAHHGAETPGNFLEIGAGGAQFLQLMVRSKAVRNYVILDLPAMLINSMLNTKERFPRASIHLNEIPDLGGEGPAFCFIEADRAGLVPRDAFDVAVNFNSFMEMDRDVRDNYFSTIYECLKDGGIFYNVNRRQMKMTMRDGSPYDNNPLLYPYLATDTVLEWEPDEFQQDYRSRNYKSAQKSFCVSRISKVRKGEPGTHH